MAESDLALSVCIPLSGNEAEKGLELIFKIATPANMYPGPKAEPFQRAETGRSEEG